MKKIIDFILLSLLFVLCLVGCSTQSKLNEPPEISISVNDAEIEYVVDLNQWNGNAYDRLDTFDTILNESSDFEAPYIELGKKIQIKFTKNDPESFIVYDYVLDQSEDLKSSVLGDQMNVNMLLL